KSVPGVAAVVSVRAGVAVVASGFWPAKLGRDALDIVWEEGPNATLSTASLREQYANLAKTPGAVARKDGDPTQTLASAAKQVTAEYEVPYLAHAMMEPLNCLVDLRSDRCEIWTGTQFQTVDRAAAGNPVAWTHTIVGQSILAGTMFESVMVKNGIDGSSVEGAAELPYAIPNVLVDLHSPKVGVPVQWWRSVGHSHTGFVVESFLDELAHTAGKDPYEFRRALLAHQPRYLGVLELAASNAKWGAPLPG